MNKEDKDKTIKILEDKQKHLTECLGDVNKVNAAVPDIKKNLDMTEWSLRSIKEFPEEAINLLPDELPEMIQKDWLFTQTALPRITGYDNTGFITDSTSVTTSGTLFIFEGVSGVANLGRPELVSFSEEMANSYRDLQAKQNRASDARHLLENFHNTQCLERFNRAETAYESSRAGTASRREAALEIRTFIDGMKGALFELARTHPGEDVTWERMAERLAKNGAGGTEYYELVNAKIMRSKLIDHLSTIAKDREGSIPRDLDNVWAETLDHIYTVLGLIII